jgi:D-glycero-D-manno-heptose 1,7-bisphosphate phosphatase
MIKVIVLDRDGVINEDSPEFIRSADQWHAIRGSLEAIALLVKAGYLVVVATNQSGIARRYFTLADLNAIHQKMIGEIEAKGGKIKGIFVCPHGPQEECLCRKPKPGLLLEIAKKLAVKPEEMLIIGDSMRDLESAKRCGARAILVKTGKGEHTFNTQDVSEYPVFADLKEAVDFILSSM